MHKKIEHDFGSKQKEFEQQIRDKSNYERRTKLKPIIKEELEQFSSKVDKIVSYLTNKRKEERIEQNYVDMDFQALRSHTYEQVVQQERE